MILKSGARLGSNASTVQVVVVRASNEDVDLRCGGVTMVPLESIGEGPSSETAPASAEKILMGKRYVLEDDSIELLVTKGGDGVMTVGPHRLQPKDAKPLPASD